MLFPTLTDTINITNNPPHLPVVVKKIDIAGCFSSQFYSIGSLNPAADFTSSDWACGTFIVKFIVSVSVHSTVAFYLLVDEHMRTYVSKESKNVGHSMLHNLF
jgi:hypothetical protein